MFEPNDRVLVSEKQLHGNSSVITSGEVISVQGNHALVVLDGEEIHREIPVDMLSMEESTFGSMSGRLNEQPVIDAIRR